MSYKTKVDGVQIFGDNEIYPEWLEFIKTQHIEIDKEGCYSGEIYDFMSMMMCIEQIVINIENRRQNEINELKNREKQYNIAIDCLHDTTSPYYKTSLFDLQNIYDETIKDMHQPNEDSLNSLFDRIYDTIEHGYIFLPYQLYNICKDKLKPCASFTTKNHFRCFQLKKGESIHIHAS